MKRRSFGKEAAVLMRSPRLGSSSRRRRNCRNMEQNNASEAHEDDNNDDINNNNNGGGKDSSSDERGTEVRLRKRKKRSTGRTTLHPSSSGANNNNNNGNCADNDTDVNRDSKGITPGLVWNPEILAWGRGGTRSNTRHGNNNPGGSSKSVRNARVNRLVEHLRSSIDRDNAEVPKRRSDDSLVFC